MPGTLVQPAYQALLPALVDREDLAQANTLGFGMAGESMGVYLGVWALAPMPDQAADIGERLPANLGGTPSSAAAPVACRAAIAINSLPTLPNGNRLSPFQLKVFWYSGWTRVKPSVLEPDS